MAMEDTYYLREECIDPDSEDDFAYDEVSVRDAAEQSSGDEDLSAALHNVQVSRRPAQLKSEAPLTRVAIHSACCNLIGQSGGEVVEDFVRNYLVRNGLLETADTFQREWFEHAQCGTLKVHQTQHLPDIYAQNRALESALEEVTSQLSRYKEAARLAKEKYVRIQKERDYHRMHHRRVVQDKSRLLADMKRLKTHLSTYEPVLQQLKQKYQTVTKEKMLACLERDRAVSEVGCLQTTLQSVQRDKSQTSPTEAKQTQSGVKSKVCSAEVPNEPSNPHRKTQAPVCAHLTRTAGFQPLSVIPTHEYAVSSLAIHPTKPLLVTGSDDHSWRLWVIPSGELLMTGEGHWDWVSSVHCHPGGFTLASTSGDGTVKLWDFESASCVHTFSEHQQPVWGCSWHWAGDFLASAGMDHTAKVWDVTKSVCTTTLRGHADSVNAISFVPYSNTLLTGSADKTVSMWDIRTGLCVHTLYGHANSCNDVQATLQGYEVYSCDCFGGLIQWDIRSRASSRRWYLGPYSVNSMTIDPAGSLVCCASDEGTVRIVDTSSDKEWSLQSEDRVLDVLITSKADTLLSANSSGEVTVWQ